MKHRPNRNLFILICCLIALAIPSAAFAQQYDTNFDHEFFTPLPSQGTNILNAAKSDVMPHLHFSAGLFASWERNPVIFRQIEETRDSNKKVTGYTLGKEAQFISNQVRLDLGVGFGLFDVADLSLSIPLIVYQNGSSTQVLDGLSNNTVGKYALTNDDMFAIGALRFTPKVRILDPKDYSGFGLGVIGNVEIPFVDAKYNSFYKKDNFVDGLSGGGSIIADYHHDTTGIVATLNLGAKYQPARQFGNYKIGNILDFKFGLEVPLTFAGVDWLKFVGTAYAAIPFDFLNGNAYKTFSPIKVGQKTLEPNNKVAEWAAGLQANYDDLVFTLGAGTGFPTLTTNGTPSPRVFLGIGYTPLTTNDRDHDGIPDDVDQCPDQPEDKDGFQDKDGCPDPDNDNDGIMDVDDRCPGTDSDNQNTAGPLANQGCPWGDRDGDGVMDNADNCPDQPGPAATQGCPLTDSDGDGIPDDKDKCPNEPEDKDGFEDSDGCPDTDNDHDGIPDAQDKCPNDPEDKDGFQDDDGCPDPDNDNDGIPDDKDKCPNKPETYNGYKDDDGCPDKGKSKVIVTETKIEILEKVFFANNKAIIRKRSYGLLNQVASVLKNYQRITQVRVDGYTDSRGKAAYNLKLSQDRADAVRKYLIDHGVSPDRLLAKGFGEEDPIDTNDTAAGRERNRRVEFTITEINGKPVDTNSITIKKREVETQE